MRCISPSGPSSMYCERLHTGSLDKKTLSIRYFETNEKRYAPIRREISERLARGGKNLRDREAGFHFERLVLAILGAARRVDADNKLVVALRRPRLRRPSRRVVRARFRRSWLGAGRAACFCLGRTSLRFRLHDAFLFNGRGRWSASRRGRLALASTERGERRVGNAHGRLVPRRNNHIWRCYGTRLVANLSTKGH